jgi:hypothetical protein
MTTPRALKVIRLRSVNRLSFCGCVHGTTIHGVACGGGVGRRTTHVQRFVRRLADHRLPFHEDVFEADGHAVRCPHGTLKR